MTSATPLQQFQALQQQLRQGTPQPGTGPTGAAPTGAAPAGTAPAGVTVEALLEHPLTPRQRALVLQLQGELLRSQGKPLQALEVWQQSLRLHVAPKAALGSLELLLLPAVDWQQRDRWLELMRELVRCGAGPALLRLLFQVLDQYPVAQQGEELVRAIDQADALELAAHPRLRPAWLRLQRLVAER